jgi:hypothetical protein
MAGFTTNDELDFWIGNEKTPGAVPEHALFCSLLLADGTWQTDAKNLFTTLDAFRKSRSSDPKVSSKTLSTQVATAIQLTMKFRAFLMALYDSQTAGNWQGWAYPSFIAHIRKENDYFVERLSNKTPEPKNTELCRILVFSLEHAALAEKLVDPSERKKIEEARKFILLFQDITARGMHDGDRGCENVTPALIDISAMATKRLDAYFRSIAPGKNDCGCPGSVQSILHPVLSDHILREGRRFLAIIERIRTAVLKERVAALQK